MSPDKPPSPDRANEEISSLIATLHATEQRLEELTGGEVDTVADGLGRPFLLRHAQEDLRESTGAWQAAILDALPANIALLDSEGIVTSVNDGWRRIAEANGLQSPAYGIGLDYVAICERAASEGSPGAQPAAEAVRGCLAGEAQSAAIEYPCHSPTEQRWFVMTVTAVSHAFPRGAVVMHLDVTGRRRVEEMLRQASQGVVRGRRKRIRAELLILVAATAVFLGLSLRLDWFEAAAGWISARAVGGMHEIIFSAVFALAGLTVFALRRWRESESELNTREQSLAVEGSLRDELERLVRQRTEELGRTNQSLNAEIAERKRSEQTAERALQRLTEAQRIGQIGDWELDLATQAISWSPQVFEILGRDPRLGPPDYMEHTAIYDAASQSVQAENVARVIESGNPQDYELRARRPNGVRVDVLARAAARKDENGRVVGLYGTVQDITERKRSEAAVKEGEQRYRSLFENILEGYAYCATVFEHDRLTNFTFLEVNSAFETLTGLKDVAAKQITEIVPDTREANPELLEFFGRVALSGEPEKCEAYIESLSLWLSITAYSSDREHFVAVFDDITARKRAEDGSRKSAEQLQIERARLVMAQQVAKVGSWETDLSTGNVVWSEEIHRIHETEPATHHPTHAGYLALVHPDDRAALERAFARSVDQDSHAVIEHRLLLADGRIKFVEQRWHLVSDGKGIPVRAIGTCQDITERKIAEEKIVHLSRVRAMLSGISALIVRVSAREELFKGACRVAVEAGGFRMSLIAIVDPELGRIVPLASAGKDDGLMSAVNSLLSEPELAPQTMAAKAIGTKKAIVSNDSQSDPRVLLGPRYTESAVRSIAVLPLIISNEAVGVLALYSSEVEFFHEEEMKLLTDLANDIAFGLGAIQARAERERAVEALRSSLKDKEALLKEVHHRVKNNMQVITSLLRLESNRIDHPTTRSVLKDMQNRIQAMAALHEAVYRSDNFSQVDLGAYLRQISGQLGRSLIAVPGQISFRLDLISVTLDLDQAIPCGLIVNELVSNALKHAFPDGRSGEVRIELERMEGGDLRLRITDDGIGLPPDFDVIRAKSLGLQLVSDLARQLGGSLQVGPGPEAVFEVRMASR